MNTGRYIIDYNKFFIPNVAQIIQSQYGHDTHAWQHMYILVPHIRLENELRSALIEQMSHPHFLPRILTFRNIPKHLGYEAISAQPLTASQQTTHLFALLPTTVPLQRLECARSWQRQMDELAQHAQYILSIDQFRSMFQPIWPGDWSDDLYDLYKNNHHVEMRQQTHSVWDTWDPNGPVVVAGSTGSTYISQGWIQWALQREKGCVIERSMTPTPHEIEQLTRHAHIVHAQEKSSAIRWLCRQVESTLKESRIHHSKMLTIVAPPSFEELYQKLIMRGIAVDRWPSLPINHTPAGQFLSCLVRLLSCDTPSPILFLDCLKRIRAPHVLEAEKAYRDSGVPLHHTYQKLWDTFLKRPSHASLSGWWQYIHHIVEHMYELSHSTLLESIRDWPHTLKTKDVDLIPASLLPYIGDWWPTPSYRSVHASAPRVQWVGSWEVRGLRSEHIWMCGINEGLWPATNPVESWLSPHDRQSLGLPDTSHFDRLFRHDLLCTLGAAHNPPCWITLCDHPPSRWVTHVTTNPEHVGQMPYVPQAKDIAPVGPMKTPIKDMTITEADRLMRDPYAYYVRSVLRLKEQNQLPCVENSRANTSHARREKGILFHRAMHMYSLHRNESWIDLLDTSHASHFFWLHQLRACINNLTFSTNHASYEENYHLCVHGIHLTGRVDRVDHSPFGIIDYKTGALPTLDAVCSGQAPQLALETLLVANHHKKTQGVSTLLSLKHAPQYCIWEWKEKDLHTIQEAFTRWMQHIQSFQANSSPGMEHMERTDSWLYS